MTARQRLLDLMATKQPCAELDTVRLIEQCVWGSCIPDPTDEARAYAWLADQCETLP